MSELKCPFCQQELEKRHVATTDYNSMFITYYCGNPECESTTDLIGCKEFWDILGQLIRTRKAFDVAVDALKSAHDYYEYCIQRDKDYGGDDINWDCTAMNMDNDISEALEQINNINKGEQ